MLATSHRMCTKEAGDWRVVVGEPFDLTSYGPEAADDALLVHRLNERIRTSLQALVDQARRTRGGALV